MITSCHSCYYDIYENCLLHTDQPDKCKWYRDLKEGSPSMSTMTRVRNEISAEYWSQPVGTTVHQTNRKLKFIQKGDEL